MSSQICPHCRRPYMSHMISDFVNNNCAFTPPSHDTIPTTRHLSEEELQSILESLRSAGYNTAQFDKRVIEQSNRKAQIADQLTGARPQVIIVDEHGLDSFNERQFDEDLERFTRREDESLRGSDRVGDEAQTEDGITRDSQGENSLPK